MDINGLRLLLVDFNAILNCNIKSVPIRTISQYAYRTTRPANVVKSRTRGFCSFFYDFVGFALGNQWDALAVADAEIDNALVVVGVNGNDQIIDDGFLERLVGRIAVGKLRY